MGSITRAAEQLFVAQPALGMQIRSLEESLGVELLLRHSRGVAATPAGEFLCKRAQEILRLVDDTQREISQSFGRAQVHVTLGLTHSIMNVAGRDIALGAHSQLPDIHVSLVEEMSVVLIDALERHEIDLALAYDVAERPGLLRLPLLEEELLLVTAPDEAPAQDQVNFGEAVARPLVMAVGRDVVRLLVTSTAVRLGVPANIAYDVSSVAGIKDMVANGGVATIMPMGVAIHDMQLGRLAVRRIVEPTLKRTLYLARSAERSGSAAENRLVDLLGGVLLRFVATLAPLARGLPALERPLSEILAGQLGKARAFRSEA